MTTKLNFKNKYILFVFLIGFYSSAQTITPFLDPSIKFVKTMNTFNKVGESTDGKVWYTTTNTKNVLNFLNTDGSINAFSQDLGGVVNAIAPTTDNKVLIGGNFTTYNSTIVSARLLRLNADGTRDFTFSASANANEITALLLMPDGKIMVGRNTQISRLNADGSTDTAFAIVTTNGKINEFCMSATGKIFAVGTFTSVNSITKNRAILINNDGTIDTTFNIGSGFNAEVKGIKRTSTNNLYIIGAFSNYNGATVNRFVKLNETGILNTTFINTLAGFNDNPLTVEVSNNDKLLIGGLFTMYNTINVKNFVFINEDGTINPSFNVGNSFENGSVNNITKNSLGNYIIIGEFVKYKDVFTNQIVKVTNNGTIVSGFSFGNSFNLNSFIDYFGVKNLYNSITGNTIKVKSQGDKILVSEVYINNKRYPLARFNSLGLLDTTFLFNYTTLNLPPNLQFSLIRDFCFTPDNKIFLFLTNKVYEGTGAYAVSFLKLNSNGSLYTSFSNANFVKSDSFGNSENMGYVRNDNKIIWATSLSIFSTITLNGVALAKNFNLLQSNGEFDEGYTSNNLTSNSDQRYCTANSYNKFNSTKILPLPNNETLVYSVGQSSYCRFDGVAGSTFGSGATIGRFSATGTLITDFQQKINLGRVTHANCHDGFLYLAGTKGVFIKYNVQAIPDNSTFNYQSTGLEIANTLFKNNKIYVASAQFGPRNSFGGYNINYIITRLNLDGTVDNSFKSLNVIKYQYESIEYTGNNQSTAESFQLELVDNPNENSFCIVARNPISINGTYYEQAFVKVDLSSLSTKENQFSDSTIKCYPNPTNDLLNISSQNETIKQINVYNLLGALLKSKKGNSDKEEINIQDLPNATYLVEIKTDKETQTVKIVKE